MQSSERLALVILVAMVAFGMLIGSVGIGPTPLEVVTGWFRSSSLAVSLGPFGVFYFIVYAVSTHARRPLAAVIGFGVAASVLHLVLYPVSEAAAGDARTYMVILGLWLGAAGLAVLGWQARRGTDPDERAAARAALAGCAFFSLWGSCVVTYLYSTVVMHPATYDAVLYRFDQTLGFQPSAVAARIANALPPTTTVLMWVYGYTAVFYAVVYGVTLRRRARPPLNMLYIWALSGLGFLAYQFYPAAGPIYAFGGDFPDALPPADSVPASLAVVQPAPRNAMPSLHGGWTLALWAYSRLLGVRWLERGCLVVLVLTLAATLARGEHYVIDLVVAVPFVAALLAAGLRTVSWRDPVKRGIVVWGAGLWLAWIVALRGGLWAFEALPGLSWVTMLATVGYGVVLFRRFFALARSAAPDATLVTVPRVGGVRHRGMLTATVLFFASGFTALVYEVVFSKSLGLVFGSMATATYTVLATYMGGMALGAWIGGRIAARRTDPLLIYALCEGAIGLYCALTPWLFEAIKAAYVPLAEGLAPDAPVLIVLRVLLGGGALLVPTVLMGITLPALARFFEPAEASMGRSVAALYGANTLGAAFGALLAGYAILPVLGLTRSIALTAIGSLLVALVALKLRERVSVGERGALAPAAPRDAGPAAGSMPHRGLLALAFATLLVTGLVTLALEVLYMHLLAVVAGNSAYAFSLMLFTFLLGLGGGAALSRGLLRLRQPLVLSIGWLQLGLAAVALFGVLQWDRIPFYFASFGAYPVEVDFTAREAIRAVVCFAAMFPPAFAIGALYPLAIELATRTSRQPAVATVGRAAALNTVGNIAGVLLAGFVLLPLLGSVTSIRLLAAIAAGLGVVCLWTVRAQIPGRAWAPAALVVLAFAVQPRALDYTALASGANVYFRAQLWGDIIDHAESVDGGLTSVAARGVEGGGQVRTLLTNGKFQGNNATGGEMKAQAGFALAPLLHVPQRERALVIGYGTGGSAHTVQAAGFRELDIVELSADVVRLADRHFPEVNHGVTGRPGVRLHVTDGRNFLLLQPHSYDLISMEISSIWFAGAANLYNREFYRLAKARLAPGGVLQQWVQLHHIRTEDVLYVLGSVRSEFRFVWVYLLGDQGIIVATNDAQARPSAEHVRRLSEAPGLKEVLALYGGRLDEVRESVLIDPRGLDHLLAVAGVAPERWVATDDNLVLEYGTPKGNALDGAESMRHNVATLQRFQAEAIAKAP